MTEIAVSIMLYLSTGFILCMFWAMALDFTPRHPLYDREATPRETAFFMLLWPLLYLLLLFRGLRLVIVEMAGFLEKVWRNEWGGPI